VHILASLHVLLKAKQLAATLICCFLNALLTQVPWENQNMHCIVTVYGCAVHIDNSNELD
jgi:hypothetical protein